VRGEEEERREQRGKRREERERAYFENASSNITFHFSNDSEGTNALKPFSHFTRATCPTFSEIRK
jgi:hypothetical protein